MAARKLRVAGVVALALMLTCSSAIAAPPADPPGKSADAPGHQKDEGSPAEPESPGHANAEAAAPQEASAAAPAPPVELQAPEGPVESPRFTNAAGKPKHNVPAAAEAAPEASVSAPGNSGRHKITICHKGHAITVDVHAATAHVDGHGDNYLPAGTKGRAVCPHSSGPPSEPTPQNETPSGPGGVRPDPIAAVAGAGRGTNDPATASGGNGISATSHEERGGILSASGVAGARGSLPFTGAPLGLLVLFGVGLVGGGLILRRASLGWAPSRSSSR